MRAAASLPGSPGPTYIRRRPEETTLHGAVHRSLPTWLVERDAREMHGGSALPRVVRRELDGFLKCGRLEHGFARFRCGACGTDRLVALTCKGRGFCPSCMGRRMVRGAAHLVDHVLPHERIRQWVLSLPFALRWRLAWDHPLALAVLKVVIRALRGHYRTRARRARVKGRVEIGTVTVLQRFGSALNLNLHFHILAVDGVCHRDAGGQLRFTRIAEPTDDEVADLADTIAARVRRLLVQRGVWEDDLDGGRLQVDEPPALADLYEAAVRGVAASGPRAGRPLERQGTRFALEPGSAFRDGGRPDHGFDLHASVVVSAKRRDRLEALCRYLLRPPLSDARLEALPDGRYRLRLKTAWRDGTSHLLLSGHELLNRLAALVPAPRKNQVVYPGVLAGRSTWRRAVVPKAPAPSTATTSPPPRRNPTWADLLRRGLAIDGLACPKDGCAGRLRFVAVILRQDVIDRILAHLGLAPRAPPRPSKRLRGQLALPGM
ncbi:MAG: transposase [Sandaracinaceae bacterium]